MYFHYNSNQQIVKAARVLSSKTNPILALLATPVDESVKWFTTSSFVDYTGLWRASVNKSLQEYLELGWVEHVSIENVPVIENGERTKFRKRNLWKLSDQEIGIELLFNPSLDSKMLELGALALDTSGFNLEQSYRYDTQEIAAGIKELSSEPILNFLNAFNENELYYRDAVEKLRGNDIACPKHDKLAKLCDVEFEEIGIDRVIHKILDRKFSPDKSSGAPGYTYYLKYPGIRFNLRSTVKSLDMEFFRPSVEDWQNSEVTASQISTLREGVVVGINSENQ